MKMFPLLKILSGQLWRPVDVYLYLVEKSDSLKDYESIIDHHKHCLKDLFFKYYKPLTWWQPQRDMSTTFGEGEASTTIASNVCGDLFDWTDQEIGSRVI